MGTHRFLFKVPRTTLGLDVVDQYCVGDYVTAWTVGEHLLLDMTSDEYDGDWEESAEDSLSVLIGVRAELASGDLRALTAPQRVLAEYLRVDPDVLEVAAAASPNLVATIDDPSAVAAWISGLDVADKDGLLLRVALGESTAVRAELLRRYRGGAAQPATMVSTRTVADLLDGAARHRAERERARAAERDGELARQEAERVRVRERRLRRLTAEGEAVWGQVETLVEIGRGRSYDEAAELLADLRELAERDGHTNEFACRVANLRERHARRPAFLRRLADLSITR